MTVDEAQTLGQVAMLHDIGKIAIPDSILGNPGRLSSERFRADEAWLFERAIVEALLDGRPRLREIAETFPEVASEHDVTSGQRYRAFQPRSE